MTIDSESTGLYPYTPPSRAPAGSRAKRSRLTRTAVALAVVLGTGAGSVAVAQAGTTGSNNSSNASAARTVRTPPAAAGKVASVDTAGNSFTLTEHSGTVVTVEVSSTTTYKDGKVTASSTVTATSVLIGFAGMGHNHGWGGRSAPASTS